MTGFAQFDEKNFQDFIKQFDDGVKGNQLLKEIEQAFQKVTGKTLTIIKKNSQVDIEEVKKSWNASSIKKNGNDLMVEIYNNNEYAIFVEKGYRTRGGGWVEGQFMLEKSVKEIEKVFEDIIGETFEKALEHLLGE